MKLKLEYILNHKRMDDSIEMVELINEEMIGRIAFTTEKEHAASHILYIIKELMGDDCKKVLDIGTLWGGSVITMMQSEYESHFVSIDLFDGYYKYLTDLSTDPRTATDKHPNGLTNTISYVTENVEKFNKYNHSYDLIQGSSHDSKVIDKVHNSLENSVDLLFIDGDHRKLGVIQDWDEYSELVTSNGIVVFDDYWTGELSGLGWPKNKAHWNEPPYNEPERMDVVGAVEEIKSYPNFSKKWIEVGLVKDKLILQRK